MSSVTPNTIKNKPNKSIIYLSYIVNPYISDYDSLNMHLFELYNNVFVMTLVSYSQETYLEQIILLID